MRVSLDEKKQSVFKPSILPTRNFELSQESRGTPSGESSDSVLPEYRFNSRKLSKQEH